MLYLQVLATRQGAGRESHETPHDFARRLSAEWTGLEEPLRTIRDRYERVRYGESEEDRQAAIAAWRQIRDARRGAEPKSPEREPDQDKGIPDRHLAGVREARIHQQIKESREANKARRTIMQ
jgi:hypothetical protein